MAARSPASGTAAPLVPPGASLIALREVAAGCQACDLWRTGTQTVFGAGPRDAAMVLVGEQPGNDEDLQGLPFVGPAGRVLDRALVEAGIDRDAVYLTNAVKHFKWVAKGKRRIHQKPNAAEIRACKPWLVAEFEALRPRVVVLLGATAAQSLLGPSFRVTEQRGLLLTLPEGLPAVATIHPSAVLRSPDDERRRLERRLFTEDLRVAAGLVRKLRRAG